MFFRKFLYLCESLLFVLFVFHFVGIICYIPIVTCTFNEYQLGIVDYGLEFCTPFECTCSNAFQVAFFNRYFFKVFAINECIFSNSCYATRYYNACNACTTTECPHTDSGHTIRNRHTRQASTILECTITDTSYIVRNFYARQIGTS